MVPAIGSSLPSLDLSKVSGDFGTRPLSGASAAQTVEAPQFSDVMKQVASDAIGSLKNAEAVSIQGVKGQASTQAVVDAVMSAERTLQTAVAVRDKVVAAYLDLSRMAI
ncbi:flagellar hook-basal body complex protein FliE [Mangrovibrevibacter kandeliae]|uniref:flagellar hook-basal body complex protein FliE n=1 Tax=Mangrovibrevibacter kandeliae TaxID=2968473 RepID=UPI002118D336|nr:MULTISPECIES: flagellar hook-basal body complex protein FliE [unclassified Aurantimonas]MCQ8780916.1 flagellar hook-basal body complex protein FliE [Aurantimonas sp. CSK15Z-1]MCW4113697.1 flagellar hook-basal body complex protein FliE [Aurantimonas sp. MSK8Z-1]